ncbi:MAG: GNAT family N-acetyltransferase [Acidimicrobiales bacterium]
MAPVRPEQTFALRQQVLRPHQRLEDMGLDGSAHPDAVAIGAIVAATGEVVGTAAVTPEDPPAGLAAVIGGSRPWRLRSMATRPDLRGAGIGAAVLEVVIGHVATSGGGVIWCNARTPALSFYKKAGFVTFGEPWVEADIGPHVVMWRTVPSSTDP